MNPKPASMRPLYWVLAVCLAPIVASFVMYYWMPPSRQVNYGTLLEPPSSLAGVAVRGPDGKPLGADALRGKWVLLMVDAPACAAECAEKLYATRQARTMQGKERERVLRLWLLDGEGAPAPELLAAHPDLQLGRADPAVLAVLSGGAAKSGIWLADPLGNLILRYPADPDIKRLNKDIARLLSASRIG